MIVGSIIILASFVVMNLVGRLYGILLFLFGLFWILNKLGLFKGIRMFTGELPEGVAYLYDYLGEYKDVGKEFNKMKEIIKKFKLGHSVCAIGFYYDNPETSPEPNKLKASIGLFKRKSAKSSKVDEEIEDFLFKEHKMTKHEIKSTKCLQGEWTYSNNASMIVGIMKYYKELKKNLSNEAYVRSFGINKEMKCGIELYEPKKIKFYTPINGGADYVFYGK